MTQVPVHSADPPGPAGPAGPAEPAGQAGLAVPAERPRTYGPLDGRGPTGPIERLMSAVIRKLAWSRLADPKIAIAVSGAGLLLGMLVGATAPNAETLPIRLPLSYLLPPLGHSEPHVIIASAMLYTGDILACLGLAGMLWAHSQGWRPDPRHLLLVSSAIVAAMVSLTPVGSSDTASYAAYGRIAAQGGNPYTTNPLAWLGPHSAYTHAVGTLWKQQPSVYGPFATWIQSFAASIGEPHVELGDRDRFARARRPPVPYRLRLRPGAPDFFRGDRVAALDDEEGLFCGTGGFHRCSSSCW